MLTGTWSLYHTTKETRAREFLVDSKVRGEFWEPYRFSYVHFLCRVERHNIGRRFRGLFDFPKPMIFMRWRQVRWPILFTKTSFIKPQIPNLEDSLIRDSPTSYSSVPIVRSVSFTVNMSSHPNRNNTTFRNGSSLDLPKTHFHLTVVEKLPFGPSGRNAEDAPLFVVAPLCALHLRDGGFGSR